MKYKLVQYNNHDILIRLFQIFNVHISNPSSEAIMINGGIGGEIPVCIAMVAMSTLAVPVLPPCRLDERTSTYSASP